MIDNEIDNRLRRANVPTNEQTTRSIPLERAERALDAQNDRSLEWGGSRWCGLLGRTAHRNERIIALGRAPHIS
jgi:hypothetical protein